MEQPLIMPEMEDPRPKSSGGKVKQYKMIIWETLKRKPISHWILLSLSSAAILVAFPASSLLSRLYFSNGGKSKWVISWVAVAGWPIPAAVLIPTYFVFGISPTPLDLKLTASYVVLGFLSAADNLMYAYGYAYMPASTASLLGSSSLIFSALFGYLVANNAINACTLNAVVLITAAVAIIAVDSDSDLDVYAGVTEAQYAVGFLGNVAGSVMHGLIFALSELVFVRWLGRRSFHVVLEQQVMVSLFGFVFTTVGLVANGGGFGGMAAEAEAFEGGRGGYISVLIWSVVTFQLGILGATAIVFLASTVLAGVLDSIRVPLTSIAAVVLMNDPMSSFKIMSLLITVWGFGSYVYGSYPQSKDTLV